LLLYNQRKEFVGIDENDLNGLGFQSINELQNESSDFADLFVKKPGFIHNFKNFSWIDFILHSESDEAKAVIHAKGKNYSCTLHVSPFYFTSDESGYAILIKNLRPLKGAEDVQATKDLEASGGLTSSPAPKVVPTSVASSPVQDKMELDISLDDIQMSEPETSTPPAEASSISEPELPSFETSHSQELSEPDPLDFPESLEMDRDLLMPTENEFGAPLDIDYGAPLDIDDDLSVDDVPDMDDSLIMDDSALDELLLKDKVVEVEESEPEIEPAPAAKASKPMLGDYVSSGLAGEEHLSDLIRSGDYQYDPQIAADELGLPVDLIEEFIGDFIDQAHEFHDDLYASVNANDFDNVQILSHKLKGVAANLRVEDAFDALSVVNVSKETEEILPNLNHFYKIIAKLEGKEIVEETAPTPVAAAEPETVIVDVEEEDYDIGIKQPEDGPMLIDEEVNSNELYDELLAAAEPVEEEEDDIYGDDLLLSPDTSFETHKEPADTSADLDDDLYDDLLGSADDLNEPEEKKKVQETPVDIDDDLYDDLLGAPENDTKASPAVEVTLNFDSQRTANELGIPLDIVKDFVQDFKKQISMHQKDFDAAISAKEIQGINKTATLLKGMSDNLRLNEISEVLKGLQVEKDINNTTEALATLQAYADQL
jgi:HPt (histidine-containing phosphotransfer) domain-containing protein